MNEALVARCGVVMVVVGVLVGGWLPAAGARQTGAEPERTALVVATKIAEPFVSLAEGSASGGSGAVGVTPGEALDGISIELWNRVAARLGVETEFHVFEVDGLDAMLAGVEAGRFGAGIAAISVTPDREARLDMTHGYFTAGLGIAVPAGDGGPAWVRGLANLFTWQFFSAVAALGVVLLGVGALVWVVERRGNSEQFEKHPAKGIGSGFWFAAVTMTTVGYGDKAPRTPAGKVLTLVWMFASVIFISAFTGAIASSLTAAQIGGAVRGPEDLSGARVGTLAGSATVQALRGRGVSARRYSTVAEGLAAVDAGEIDAFVHDWAILQNEAQRGFAGRVRMLEVQFDLGTYAIALPSGSDLRERINQEILEITRSAEWEAVLTRYLGPVR